MQFNILFVQCLHLKLFITSSVPYILIHMMSTWFVDIGILGICNSKSFRLVLSKLCIQGVKNNFSTAITFFRTSMMYVSHTFFQKWFFPRLLLENAIYQYPIILISRKKWRWIHNRFRPLWLTVLQDNVCCF